MTRWFDALTRVSGTTLRIHSNDPADRRNLGMLRPLPHPAAQSGYSMGGRVGERAGAARRSPDRPNTPSSRALTRAREALGVPFRLHGRDLRGMDCVGLVAWAWEVVVPTGYALRASPRLRIEAELAALGFVAGEGAGAVILIAPGPGQLHLGISTGDGVIHADATARRVVERVAPLPWAAQGSWIREV